MPQCIVTSTLSREPLSYLCLHNLYLLRSVRYTLGIGASDGGFVNFQFTSSDVPIGNLEGAKC